MTPATMTKTMTKTATKTVTETTAATTAVSVDRRPLASSLFVAVTVLAGCGSGAGTKGPVGPVGYAVAGVVLGDTTTMTYVSLLPSLDVTQIDDSQALEIAGRASIATYGGWLFVTGGDDPTITRYAIGDDGSFTKDGPPLSFAGHGLESVYIDDWGNTFVSATKAYLSNSASGTIVWNPTTMTITKEITTPELERAAALSIDGSPGALRGNRLYRTFFWKDWDEYLTLPEQYLAVFDVDNDVLIELVPETRCPGLNNRVSQNESGDLYFSNWVYNVTETLGRGAPKSCALRLPAGSDGFDPAWRIVFSDVTQGREAAALNYLANGKGFITVFHDENVTIDASSDLSELALGANWKLWSVDLEARTASPLVGIDWLAGGYATVKEDGRTFVLVPGADYAVTTVHEITAADGAQRRFEVKGFSYQLLKLR